MERRRKIQQKNLGRSGHWVRGKPRDRVSIKSVEESFSERRNWSAGLNTARRWNKIVPPFTTASTLSEPLCPHLQRWDRRVSPVSGLLKGVDMPGTWRLKSSPHPSSTASLTGHQGASKELRARKLFVNCTAPCKSLNHSVKSQGSCCKVLSLQSTLISKFLWKESGKLKIDLV